MSYLTNGNDDYVDQHPQLNVEYWRARSDELERQLIETRAFLLRLAGILPAEYLGLLKMGATEIESREPAVSAPP